MLAITAEDHSALLGISFTTLGACLISSRGGGEYDVIVIIASLAAGGRSTLKAVVLALCAFAIRALPIARSAGCASCLRCTSHTVGITLDTRLIGLIEV